MVYPYFTGEFSLDKPLSQEHASYLKAFGATRRMKRDAAIVAEFPDPIREAVGLTVGEEGEYYVGGGGFLGQEHDKSVKDYNSPPSSQPGLWCQWEPTSDGQSIRWDGGERFYNYTEWLDYIVKHFIKPWGYVLNGEVTWEGEELEDIGKITVKDNEITAKTAKITFD